MSRYIDADLLKDKTTRVNNIWNVTTNAEGKGLDEIIDDIPTADVVEVVRCKDCVYGEIDNKDFPTQYLCNHQGCDWNDKNHFCSYGERKDE